LRGDVSFSENLGERFPVDFPVPNAVLFAAMGYFLFIDESGHDRKASPYEVLAGVAVEDRVLWELICDLHEAEIRHFGTRYTKGSDELKGTNLLKTKVFNHAELNATVPEDDRAALARFALENGSQAHAIHLKALAQAKLAYVRTVFDLCEKYRCKAFASIIEADAPATGSDGLRKDYAYLFERFFYFLEDIGAHSMGSVVFDELEKSKSHILVAQMQWYFRELVTGRTRARKVIPEPFFVHSELTTGIQIADLVAYIVSWAFRTAAIDKPARRELAPFADQVATLRYDTKRNVGGESIRVWGFAHIADLRTRTERDQAGSGE
jgi:Protein of unknown function (DUF3800)